MAGLYLSEDYRHFDRLIWQVPAWSTAVFLGVMAVVGAIPQSAPSGVPADVLIRGQASALAGGLVFLLVTSATLYRYRLNQTRTERLSTTHFPPRLWNRVGAQSLLQAVVALQALVAAILLIFVSLREHSYILFPAAVLSCLLLYGYVEKQVGRAEQSRPASDLVVVRRPHQVRVPLRLGDGVELRRYYLPPDVPFEVIETVLPPGDQQEPHAHSGVREATFVVSGEVHVHEVEHGDIVRPHSLKEGDLVVFGHRMCHTMENASSSSSARTLTFKFLGEGKDPYWFSRDPDQPCVDEAVPR